MREAYTPILCQFLVHPVLEARQALIIYLNGLYQKCARMIIYTHLVNFRSYEYHTATSKSLKEDEELLKAGFEYVTERDGVKIYRKRK